MSEIPEDLIAKAETVWLETWENYQGDHDSDPIGVIAKAIYAERLRCRDLASVWLVEDGSKDFANSILGVVE